MSKIVAAALRTTFGVIHFIPSPARHHHILHRLYDLYGDMDFSSYEQGFITSEGEFYNRVKAGEEAISSGQIKELAHPPKLYSEDIW
jgi:hypothetical protein